MEDDTDRDKSQSAADTSQSPTRRPYGGTPMTAIRPQTAPPQGSYAAAVQTKSASAVAAADEDAAVAAIERQEKISKLQTNEDLEEPYDPPRRPRRWLRALGWLLLIAVLAAGAAGAAWYFWLRKEPKAASSTSQQSTTQAKPGAAPATEESAPEVESYSSPAFLLEFEPPKTWKVTEGADNKLTAVSPVMQLMTVAGSKQAGQIVFTVQRKQSSLPDFTAGNALAIRDSEKIDYKKPSQTQRASTYLSFLNFAASKSKGLDALYITGDNGYLKDQYIPQADVTKGDLLFTLTFRACDDEQCAKPGKPLTLPAGSWNDSAFAKPLRTMLQSITVQ
jgi:hypothetical protein